MISLSLGKYDSSVSRLLKLFIFLFARSKNAFLKISTIKFPRSFTVPSVLDKPNVDDEGALVAAHAQQLHVPSLQVPPLDEEANIQHAGDSPQSVSTVQPELLEEELLDVVLDIPEDEELHLGGGVARQMLPLMLQQPGVFTPL